MKKTLFLILCLAVLFTSCYGAGTSESHGSSDAPSTSSSENGTHKDKKEKQKPPKAADYAEGDIDYSVNISDESRTVTLDVTRRGGISTATVAYPEELTEMVLTDDVDGIRCFPSSKVTELTLSPEAASGLSIVFDIMAHKVSEAEFTADGEFVFDCEPYRVSLVIGSDGYPVSAVVTDGEYTRGLEFTIRR